MDTFGSSIPAKGGNEIPVPPNPNSLVEVSSSGSGKKKSNKNQNSIKDVSSEGEERELSAILRGNKCERTIFRKGDIVRLNVGGVLYTTTWDTLTSVASLIIN